MQANYCTFLVAFSISPSGLNFLEQAMVAITVSPSSALGYVLALIMCRLSRILWLEGQYRHASLNSFRVAQAYMLLDAPHQILLRENMAK